MDRLGTGLDRAGNGPHQAHLVGLDGGGMAGLAQMLLQRGCEVSGSVPGPCPESDRLRRLGVRVHLGHAIPASPRRTARLLVYGPGVAREHPERLRAARLGVEQSSSREFVGRLLGRGVGIAAVGGRRAGVAAAMVGWTLAHAGLDPTLLLSTSSPQLGEGGRLGLGPHVVVESEGMVDASDLAGVRVVLVLDDRAGPDRSAAIRRWAESAPPGGYVLGEADAGDPPCPPASSGVEVERFSLAPGHAWWGTDLKEDRGRYRFRAFHRGRFAMEVRLRVPGRQHVLGALAAAAVCGRVDVAPRAIKEALEEFAGVSRGFESRGSYRGVTLVDDEAPGPRAVAEALRSAREVFGRRRLCAAYRPDPRGDGSWPTAPEFADADAVLVVDEAGPPGGPRARDLATALASVGATVLRAAGLVEAIRELDRHLEPGDVLVTLGAGDVGTIADAFLRRLSRDRHA